MCKIRLRVVNQQILRKKPEQDQMALDDRWEVLTSSIKASNTESSISNENFSHCKFANARDEKLLVK